MKNQFVATMFLFVCAAVSGFAQVSAPVAHLSIGYPSTTTAESGDKKSVEADLGFWNDCEVYGGVVKSTYNPFTRKTTTAYVTGSVTAQAVAAALPAHPSTYVGERAIQIYIPKGEVNAEARTIEMTGLNTVYFDLAVLGEGSSTGNFELVGIDNRGYVYHFANILLCNDGKRAYAAPVYYEWAKNAGFELAQFGEHEGETYRWVSGQQYEYDPNQFPGGSAVTTKGLTAKIPVALQSSPLRFAIRSTDSYSERKITVRGITTNAL